MRRAAHPPGCARCGAGAGCSAIPIFLLDGRPPAEARQVLLVPPLRRAPVCCGLPPLNLYIYMYANQEPLHMCICVYVYLCRNVQIYVYIHIRIYIYINMCIYINICMYYIVVPDSLTSHTVDFEAPLQFWSCNGRIAMEAILEGCVSKYIPHKALQ